MHLAYRTHVSLIDDELVQVENYLFLLFREVGRELLTHLRFFHPLAVAGAERFICPFDGSHQA